MGQRLGDRSAWQGAALLLAEVHVAPAFHYSYSPPGQYPSHIRCYRLRGYRGPAHDSSALIFETTCFDGSRGSPSQGRLRRWSWISVCRYRCTSFLEALLRFRLFLPRLAKGFGTEVLSIKS